jgi:hypothetical protein
LGKAIDYALGRWETLTGYVQDGRLEIDNNLCENAIRPTAIGKKNFLFIGHRHPALKDFKLASPDAMNAEANG